MSITIYRKQFDQLSATKTLELKAVISKAFMSNSFKLTHVHISPVTIEQNDEYAMEINHARANCVKLVFSKPYTKKQVKGMCVEINELAAKKLPYYEELLSNAPTKELIAIVECLQTLTHLQDF